MSTGRPHAPARHATFGLRLALGTAAAAAVALTAGCVPGYYPGGSLASRDLYTYPSEPNWPQTVVLVDHLTEEVLWTVEVPIGQQLVVRFYEDETDDPELPALMRWELMPLGDHFGELDNAMPVPPQYARRLDTFVRTDAAVLQTGIPMPDTEPAEPPAPPEPPPAPAAEPEAAPAPELDLPPDAE